MAYLEGLVLETRACPNGCTSDDREVLEGADLLHGMPGTFRVVRCNGCGLMRTNPRPNPDTIDLYYPHDYAPHHVVAQPAAKPKRKRKWYYGARERVQNSFPKAAERAPALGFHAPRDHSGIGSTATAQGFAVTTGVSHEELL